MIIDIRSSKHNWLSHNILIFVIKHKFWPRNEYNKMKNFNVAITIKLIDIGNDLLLIHILRVPIVQTINVLKCASFQIGRRGDVRCRWRRSVSTRLARALHAQKFLVMSFRALLCDIFIGKKKYYRSIIYVLNFFSYEYWWTLLVLSLLNI